MLNKPDGLVKTNSPNSASPLLSTRTKQTIQDAAGLLLNVIEVAAFLEAAPVLGTLGTGLVAAELLLDTSNNFTGLLLDLMSKDDAENQRGHNALAIATPRGITGAFMAITTGDGSSIVPAAKLANLSKLPGSPSDTFDGLLRHGAKIGLYLGEVDSLGKQLGSNDTTSPSDHPSHNSSSESTNGRIDKPGFNDV